MPRLDDRTIAVARVYSSALLQLAEKKGAGENLLEELEGLSQLISRDRAFGDFISSPLVDADKRRESLERVLRGRASDLLVDGLQVLNRKGRLALIPAITETYRQELRTLRGQVLVLVRTAVPLSDALRERLKQVIAKTTGREGLLEETVDDTLIGGIVVQVEGYKFDASISARLRRLGESLLERGSREIEKGTSSKIAVQEG